MSNAITEKLIAAWNSTDINRIGDLYSADTRVQNPMAPDVLKGVDALKQFEGAMFSAFSDVKWKLVSAVQSGDAIAVEFQVLAKNTAPLQTPKGPIPATNRTVDVRGLSMMKLDAQGRICEERRYFDTAKMFVQLGLAA